MRWAMNDRQISVILKLQNEGRYRRGKASLNQVVFWLLNGQKLSRPSARLSALVKSTGSGRVSR